MMARRSGEEHRPPTSSNSWVGLLSSAVLRAHNRPSSAIELETHLLDSSDLYGSKGRKKLINKKEGKSYEDSVHAGGGPDHVLTSLLRSSRLARSPIMFSSYRVRTR